MFAALTASLLLLVAVEQPARATFPGENGRIAFVSERVTPTSPEGDLEIYTMSANGENVVQLTRNAATDYSPAWSPDGTKIAFRSKRTGNQEIFVMQANGTNQRNLTRHPKNDLRPNWSPDGEHIAFGSSRDGNLEVYVMNADGTGQTRLTVEPAKDTGSDWQPLLSR